MDLDSDELVHQLFHIAQQQNGVSYSAVLGHIADYFPDSNTVTVLLTSFANDGGFFPVTGQVPLGTPWSGYGWGFQVAPMGGSTQVNPFQGEPCLLLVLDRASFKTVVGAMLFGGFSSTPDPTLQGGEALLKHKTGSLLKFHNSGEVELQVAGALNATVTQDATIKASGTATVEASSVKVSNGGSLQALLNATAATLFNSHTHPTPNGVSGPPSQSMGSTEQTTILQAE